MVNSSEYLKIFKEALAKVSLCSEDIFWLSDPSFKYSLYINDAYEKIFGRKIASIRKNLRNLNKYIVPADIVHYNPFIEMIKDIKENGPGACFHEKIRFYKSDGEIILMEDRAQPIFYQSEQCIAITGVARDISIIDLHKKLFIRTTSVFPSNNKARYYLRGKYSKIYLTVREAECAFYFLQANTQKQIAKKLNLSPRTIEHILERIKSKFNLRYKTDLFKALVESDFLNTLF